MQFPARRTWKGGLRFDQTSERAQLCGLVERCYQNDLLALISLPGNSFQTGTFPAAEKGPFSVPLGSTLEALDTHPSALRCAPGGIVAEKRNSA